MAKNFQNGILFEWKELPVKDFDILVLGNGASIALDTNFSYNSLFDVACETRILQKNVQKVFEHIGSRDFELVLSMLWHTYHINKALKIKDSKTGEAYEEVRSAIAKTVRLCHPDYQEIDGKLEKISEFMKQFKFVISLNYDVIVYWAMLKGNNKFDNWYKDCFNYGEFNNDWKRFCTPYRAEGATLVFYPHGNLILATRLNSTEYKVTKKYYGFNILDHAEREWFDGESIPLFVSEGSSEQKLKAIQRSNYLSTIYYEVLPNLREKMLVYGWGLKDNDDHILRQLSKNNLTDVAISIYSPKSKINDEMLRIKQKINRLRKGINILFFNAESEGCWIY
jgi:hypothetical protein